MIMKFTDNQEFKALLQAKQKDIQQRTSDGVQETAQFQKMRTLLSGCRRKYEETDYRLVIISKGELQSLSEQANEFVEQLFKEPIFITNRTVKVNSKLEIIDSNNDPFPEENNDARRYFTLISKDSDLICFLIDPDSTINYFIDGNEYGDGIFYTSSSRKAYEELKTIDKLEEVLEDYRKTLRIQDTYVKFFIPKSQIKALKTFKGEVDISDDKYIQNNKHLLRNKPEECFREDIRNYIKRHMRVVVYRELMMENLDRLDIELLDETGRDLYFLEIKWVGQCINADGNDYGTKYTTSRVNPDAVIQVLGYINQLLEEDQNIKIGYLVVFDARKDDSPDTGVDIKTERIPDELKKHLNRYKKVDDFRVVNINPR